MLDRQHIEQILRLNGIDANSPDEQIRSLLLRARWHQDDIQTALVVLRENVVTKKRRINTLHKVFRTDDRLDSAMVSSLLGVDVNVNLATHRSRLPVGSSSLTLQMIFIVLVAVLLSIGLVTLTMWQLEIGPFHASAR